MKNQIHQYFYKGHKNRRRVGVFVARAVNDHQYGVGFSLCCPLDDFDCQKGIEIAAGRALKNPTTFEALPDSMQIAFNRFEQRAARHFKDKARLIFGRQTIQGQDALVSELAAKAAITVEP